MCQGKFDSKDLKNKTSLSVLAQYAILLVRKCINGNVCTNFHSYFMIKEHDVRTRNRNILLQIPKVKLEFAKSSFVFMGARFYNSLPKGIRKVQMILRTK